MSTRSASNEGSFLVVGAHALAAHGIPRITGDLDIWIEPTAVNASRTWRALGSFGAQLDLACDAQAPCARPNPSFSDLPERTS